ncbi:amino acid transporter AVT6A-like isoform X2 [Hibiscus syriacus]|uniref:amino acid transporter AVT6A-like isoform X2 n=1 Tax=Hibiscus syriacus TaxID=106335 RepID=UPI0019224D7B|nr:amino acid transporter AVT6A-like isoform X2 [Hibiscus syriacus]
MTVLSSSVPKNRRPPRTPLLPQKSDDESFDAHGSGFDGASNSGAVFKLSTTIVGAGIMGLPATVNQLGLIPGLLTIICVSMLTKSSIDMILRFSRASKSATYSGVAADAFGAPGCNILQACIVINNLGMLVVYMIIIGDVLSGTWEDGFHHRGLMEEWFGEHWWTTRSALLLLTTLFVFAPLISFKRVILPIENELKDSTQLKSIVRKSLALCSSVYIATSFFGVVLFGDHTMDDVIANFDGDLGIPYSLLLDDLVRVSYGLHLMLVFPIVFFSLRLNVDGLLLPYAIPIAFDDRRFFSVTVALMGFILMGANCVPSIWDAFQFTGATAAVCVGFIFPAAITLRDTHGIATKNDRLISWMMIFLAVSTSTVAVTSDIYSLFFSVDKGITS